MTTNYVLAGTGDSTGGKDSLWAIAGDAGTPCPANWIEFTRSVYDNANPLDQGSRAVGAHGNPIVLTKADWAARKALYATPVPAGSVTVEPDPTTSALLTEILAATKALNPPG